MVSAPRGLFDPDFLQGAKAAIPVWIAFLPTSFALGIAAKVHGLSFTEIILMSILVYAGPAQFAALDPLAAGRPALQILLATFLINLRFLVMSSAIAPYFRRVKRASLLFCLHFLSASSFIISYAHFQKASAQPSENPEATDRRNLRYFMGVGVSSFLVWLAGSGLGYLAAVRIPAGFEEVLKFLLPGYFACLLAVEVRERSARLVGVAALFAAVLGMMLNPNWGWLVSALLIATCGWWMEQWIRRGSPSS
jgi:predicted branched-subunit amino acid permease